MIRSEREIRTYDLDALWPGVIQQRSPAPPSPAAEEPPVEPEAVIVPDPEVPAPVVAHSSPPNRPTWVQPLIWGGGGFIAGMFAWHVIGFWSFVSHVVWSDQGSKRVVEDSEPIVTGSLREPRRLSSGAYGGLVHQPDPKRCIALAMDRTSGQSAPQACSLEAAPLRDAGHHKRTNLAATRPRIQDPAIWAGTTAVEEKSATTEAEAAEIDVSDFDLEIKVSE